MYLVIPRKGFGSTLKTDGLSKVLIGKSLHPRIIKNFTERNREQFKVLKLGLVGLK